MDQEYKTYMTLPGLHAGMLDAAALEHLAALVGKHEIPAIKITGAQRIALLGMAPERLAALQSTLGMDAGPAHSRNRVHYVHSCPGKAWCRYGMRSTLELGKRIEQMELDVPMPCKVKVGISGCRMCCCESWLRDIGLIGEHRGWRLVFGGNAGGRPRIGEELARGLDDDQALELIRRVLDFYGTQAQGRTRTARLVERLGMDAIRDAVLESQAAWTNFKE